MAKPDTTKKSTNKVAKPPKKTGDQGTFDRAAEEAILVARYPKQNIVKGSLRDSGEVPEFGQKRSVEIVCQGDHKTKRRIATSDLHQVLYCEEYIKQARLDRRKQLRAKSAKPKKEESKTKRARATKAEVAPQPAKRGRKKAEPTATPRKRRATSPESVVDTVLATDNAVMNDN